MINTGNERILLNRAFIGRNFDGRPGNIFLHLVAGLPAEFTAREAIALWQSQWWIYDDRTLAQDQFDLPQVAGAELLHGNGTIDRTALASPEMQRILPLVIQAILVKEPGQHIYIAAPPDKVAVLVWGVAQCLPDNLLRGLTFSTYEYDASAGVTDIIGSCGWPIERPVGGFDLPAQSYTGKGLGFNYYTGRVSEMQGKGYGQLAEFLSKWVRTGDSRLAQLLRMANAPGAQTNTAANYEVVFAFLAATDPEIGMRVNFAITPQAAAAILNQPDWAAVLLGREDVQRQVITLVQDNQWWKTIGKSSLTRLSSLSAGAGATNAELRAHLASLIQRALADVIEFIRREDITTANELLTELVLAFAPPEPTPWLDILRQLSTGEVKPRQWDTRYWLLEQCAKHLPTEKNRIIEELIKPWLQLTWSELSNLLSNPQVETRFRQEWRLSAIWYTILSSKTYNLPPGTLPGCYEKASQDFTEVLCRMVGTVTNREAALRFSLALMGDMTSKPSAVNTMKLDLLSAFLKPDSSREQPDQYQKTFVANLIDGAQLQSSEVVELFNNNGFSLWDQIQRPMLNRLAKTYLSSICVEDLDLAKPTRHEKFTTALNHFVEKMEPEYPLKSVVANWLIIDECMSIAEPVLNTSIDGLNRLRKVAYAASGLLMKDQCDDAQLMLIQTIGCMVNTLEQLGSVLTSLSEPMQISLPDLYVRILDETWSLYKNGNLDVSDRKNPLSKFYPYIQFAYGPPWKASLMQHLKPCQERLTRSMFLFEVQRDRDLRPFLDKVDNVNSREWQTAMQNSNPTLGGSVSRAINSVTGRFSSRQEEPGKVQSNDKPAKNSNQNQQASMGNDSQGKESLVEPVRMPHIDQGDYDTYFILDVDRAKGRTIKDVAKARLGNAKKWKLILDEQFRPFRDGDELLEMHTHLKIPK